MVFPELIIFDCDGVLVDSELIANQILAQHLSEHGYPISLEDCCVRFIGSYLPNLVSEIRSEGHDLPDDFITSLRVKDAPAFAADLQAVSGIVETLGRLPHLKCVASSGPPDKISKNLSKTGLIDFFKPHLFSGYTVENPKPAPDLFLHAADILGVAPSSCLVIEDSKLGIQAAKAAGMTCFGFTGGGHCLGDYAANLALEEPDLMFNQMNQLPELIANLAATR